MSARRIFLIAAITCAGSWLVKVAAIAATGGSTTDGGVVGVLWAAGMLAFLAAVAAGAASATAGRATWVRALLAVAAVPLGFVLLEAVDAVAQAVYPGTGWFRDETGLVVGAILLCGVAVATTRHDLGAPDRSDAAV